MESPVNEFLRLIKQCSEAGLSNYEIEKQCGLSNATVSGYLNGREPRESTIIEPLERLRGLVKKYQIQPQQSSFIKFTVDKTGEAKNLNIIQSENQKVIFDLADRLTGIQNKIQEIETALPLLREEAAIIETTLTGLRKIYQNQKQ